MDILQIFAIFACNTALYALVVAYYEPDQIGSLPLNEVEEERKSENRWVSIRFWLSNLILVVLTLVALMLLFLPDLGSESILAIIYGEAMGIASAVFQFFANFPQIVLTYQKKELGSFSLITLILQTPGNFLIAYYQFVQAPYKVGMWLCFFVGAILGLVLCIECLYYEWLRIRREGFWKKKTQMKN